MADLALSGSGEEAAGGALGLLPIGVLAGAAALDDVLNTAHVGGPTVRAATVEVRRVRIRVRVRR